MRSINSGAEKRLSPISLKAHVLCKRHNNALSPLDSIGLRLLRSFPNRRGDFVVRNPVLIDGFDFQRWLLKLLCGGARSGNLQGPEGRFTDWQPPLKFLSVIFEGDTLPPGLGVYLLGAPYTTTPTFLTLSALIGFQGGVLGLLFSLFGITLAMLMGPPIGELENLLKGAVYHPGGLNLNSGPRRAEIRFDWGTNELGSVAEAHDQTF